VLGGPRAVVIDPGPDDAAHVARVLDRARGAGRSVGLILVSHAHRDHAGAVQQLSRASGAPVGMWRSGDQPLEDGRIIAVDGVRLKVLHTPGHARDHIAFYWEDRRALFSGDLVLGSGTVVVAPPNGSMDEYLRSLGRVAGLDLEVIMPGHGPPIFDPAARVAEYIAHRLMRERQVLDALAGGARTPGEVAGLLYRNLDPRLHPAAEGTVLAHLLKLVGEGRVRREGNRFYVP
jgi:glyoxylase-like metal-dependent hydrolase (beta-lactamase superfamily II)